MSTSEELEARIDEVLAESFPASDPPPWTTGADTPWSADSDPPGKAIRETGRRDKKE